MSFYVFNGVIGNQCVLKDPFSQSSIAFNSIGCDLVFVTYTYPVFGVF